MNYYSYANPSNPSGGRDAVSTVPSWALTPEFQGFPVRFGSSPLSGTGSAYRIMDPNYAKSIDQALNKLWNSQRDKFPGSLAKSLLRKDLPQLGKGAYRILPKSDGERHILFLFEDNSKKRTVVAMRRNGFYTGLRGARFATSVFKGTVLDGELIRLYNGTWEFQVFDCVYSCGEKILDRKYSQRMEEAARIVRTMYERQNCDGFTIVAKRPITAAEARALITLGEEDMKFPYPTDGLILVPENSPYTCGKDEKLFKYKKAEEHTVDFRTSVHEQNGGPVMVLKVLNGGKLVDVERTALTENDFRVLMVPSAHAIDGNIVECKWDPEARQWRPIKIRLDKDMPNSMETYSYTRQNLTENITPKELFEALSM
jgi:hypothetical protein